MIDLQNNFHIVESLSELPNLRNRKEIFCDIESQKNFDHPKLGGLYPFKGDKICGISISADDIPDVWYVPVRHTIPSSDNTLLSTGNLPVKNVMDWAEDILQSCEDWINHFVKFDAMFFAIGDDVEFKCRLICTLNLAKLYYGDRWEFGLKPLCRDWLDYDTSSQDRVQTYLDSIRPKSKSYADVPIRILGEYANDDVRMNRKLYRFLQEKMQARLEETMADDGSNKRGEFVKQMIETEIKLTPVLFDMEKDGLRIDPKECTLKSIAALEIMMHNMTEIERLTGRSEFVNSNACLKDILLKQFKLPILVTIREKDENGRWFDTGRPSFDKDAMALYKVHPLVTSDEKIKTIIDLITEFRTEQQFKSLFLDTFLELHVDGIIHPNYNQSVKTYRMSCSKPNSQQQNQRSKKLILPHKGEGFLSNDYSQIEYRLIVHYCQIKAAIKAYNEDPDTDYHQWVADLLRIVRKPAKQLNFGMAFGQGKKGVCNKLMTDPSIMEEMGAKVNTMILEGLLTSDLRMKKFEELCRLHANSSYDAYHQEVPEIQITSRAASNAAKERGFVFNAYGYRRYLPGQSAYKAFNTIMQSSAAAIMKERMVAVSPRYNSESRKWGVKPRANVHDELLSGAPLEVLYDPELHKYICGVLENTTIKFRVPILTGLGLSPNNWSEAAGDEVIMDDEIFKNLKEYKKAAAAAAAAAAAENAGNFAAGKVR